MREREVRLRHVGLQATTELVDAQVQAAEHGVKNVEDGQHVGLLVDDLLDTHPAGLGKELA